MAKNKDVEKFRILQIINKHGINHLVEYRRALAYNELDIAVDEDAIAEELASVYAEATGIKSQDVLAVWHRMAKDKWDRIQNSLQLFAEAVKVSNN